MWAPGDEAVYRSLRKGSHRQGDRCRIVECEALAAGYFYDIEFEDGVRYHSVAPVYLKPVPALVAMSEAVREEKG